MDKLSDKFNLKDDFPESSIDDWKKIVNKDLKDISFEKQLITRTYEDIELYPIYTNEDIEDLPLIDNYPGVFNFARASNANGYRANPWSVNQEIPYGSAVKFNEALKYDLERGQNSVYITPDFLSLNGLDPIMSGGKNPVCDGLSLACIEDFDNALKGIDLHKYPVIINCGYSPVPLFPMFIAYLKAKKYNKNKVTASFLSDPIGFSVQYGEITGTDFNGVFDDIASSIEWNEVNNHKFRFIGCSGLPYTEAGASSVQELGYTMATAIEYINNLTERNIRIDTIADNFIFTLGIGSNYFMEVAKFRAARIIWSNILRNFGASEDRSKLFIHARSVTFNKTKYDLYVNMLRATTETFSAIIGGADSIHTYLFDETVRIPDEFSRRFARNIQIILKEESHLDNVIDPAGGSYYVEKLTSQIAAKAWNLIRQIEKNGGMINSTKMGIPQKEIADLFEKRKTDLSQRKTVIVGNNYYANISENEPDKRKSLSEEFYAERSEYIKKKNTSVHSNYVRIAESGSFDDIDLMIDAFKDGATIGQITISVRNENKNISIEKINFRRASEVFEELRRRSFLYKEKHGSFPSVFLITMGPVKQHKARADFSRGFFEMGGFNVIYRKGFNSVKEASETASKDNSRIFVICSTDETYQVLIPEVVKEMKSKNKDAILILAGNPKEKIDEYRNAGIDEFIYIGADAVKVLNGIFDKLI